MSWNKLLTTLDAMYASAQSDAPSSAAQLERCIVQLGQVARDLQEVPPPDQATYIRLHASLNRLGKVLPEERTLLRTKITGLVNRSKARVAYQQLQRGK